MELVPYRVALLEGVAKERHCIAGHAKLGLLSIGG